MTSTITIVPELDTEILPEIDTHAGEQLGDEILLSVAASTKVATVKAGQARSESRAWSFGGNVD